MIDKVKEYGEQARNDGKEILKRYANGIDYLFIKENDGWYCSFIYYNKKEIDGIYGLHSAYGNKVESFKFYKNGKWEVKFISEEEAQKFFDMYCKLEA